MHSDEEPQARLFVIRVTTGGPKEDRRLLGYAIAEQTGFIDAEPDKEVEREANLFLRGFEQLFKEADLVTLDAVAIPAVRDPLGGGYRMFANVPRPKSAPE